MNRILIAEDEGRIASFLEKGLRANGFNTSVASDGDQALTLAGSGEFDLLILDLGLPGRDGFSVLRELRARGLHIPVVILTARTSVTDTVTGLEGGADDYITKPFRFQELLARVRVRLRGDHAPEETVLRVGHFALDLRTRRAQVHGRTIELTAREFAMAETFFRHPGQVLTREQLLSHVWGYDYDPGSNVIDVYVRYLRKKLGEQSISTVRGVGYRLEDAPGADGPRGDRKGRVLLVEDESRIAQIVSRGLATDDLDVVVAQDGDVGLFLSATESFDLVILDVGLPGTSGVEVLRSIRGERPKVPVIVLTGRDDPAVRRACLEAGASEFLMKPFSVEDLRETVRSRLPANRAE